MELEFDFHLHSDPSTLAGTQYFELSLGPYKSKHWVIGARFIHEYTFCLIEGIFEKRLPDYDHFAFIEVPRPRWKLILRDLASLRSALESAREETKVALPYGGTLSVQADFERALRANQHSLAVLLLNLESWLQQVLTEQDVVSVLGL